MALRFVICSVNLSVILSVCVVSQVPYGVFFFVVNWNSKKDFIGTERYSSKKQREEFKRLKNHISMTIISQEELLL